MPNRNFGRDFDPRSWMPLYMAVVALVAVFIIRLAFHGGFLRYLLMVAATITGVLLVARVIHRIVGIKCPKCNLPMFHKEDRGAFTGATGVNQRWFDPIGIRVLHCKKCGKEYHKMFTPPDRAPANAGRWVIHAEPKFMGDLFARGSTIFEKLSEVNNAPPGTLTEQQYKMIRRDIAQEIANHNRKEGFQV
ncbi:MAG: hypothetical protein GX060_00200 [Firmicutes bacterium]|nr:hypothetical protein [Bacillota bacterium]